jgi:hypothetical protein
VNYVISAAHIYATAFGLPSSREDREVIKGILISMPDSDWQPSPTHTRTYHFDDDNKNGSTDSTDSNGSSSSNESKNDGKQWSSDDEDRREMDRLLTELRQVDVSKLGGGMAPIASRITLRHLIAASFNNGNNMASLGNAAATAVTPPASSPTSSRSIRGGGVSGGDIGSNGSDGGLSLANHCWDWMLSCTNLRASMYRLPCVANKQRVKWLASPLIASEPATTSAMAALATLELLKVRYSNPNFKKQPNQILIMLL